MSEAKFNLPSRARMPTAQGSLIEELLAEEMDIGVRSKPENPAFYSEKFFDETSLGQAVTEVILGLQNNMVPKTHVQQLAMNLPLTSKDDQEFGVTFSLLAEINQQMTIIKGLRNQVFTPAGQIRPDFDFKDAKYVLQANDQMLKTLMQKHKELVNTERFQKIEAAVHTAIDKLMPTQRDLFVSELNRILGEDTQ